MKKALRSIWTVPLAFLAAGFGLVLSGIGWAVATGVAIPYQDPTPAMEAYEDFHLRISDTLWGGGALLLVAALIWFAAALARHAWRRRTA